MNTPAIVEAGDTGGVSGGTKRPPILSRGTLCATLSVMAQTIPTRDQRCAQGRRRPDAPLFTDQSGRAFTGNGVRKLFDRLKVATGIDDLCAHMLRHTWATNYHRSGSGSRFDLQTEGGWRTGRMVERYTKSRPFEERRRGPSPFTAFREATKGSGLQGSGRHNRKAA